MTVIRSNYGDLYDADMYAVAFDAYNRAEEIYPKIFSVMNSSKKAEKFSAVAGVGMPGSKAEGANMEYVDPVQLYDTTLTATTYSRGLRFSHESVADQLVPILHLDVVPAADGP